MLQQKQATHGKHILKEKKEKKKRKKNKHTKIESLHEGNNLTKRAATKSAPFSRGNCWFMP